MPAATSGARYTEGAPERAPRSSKASTLCPSPIITGAPVRVMRTLAQESAPNTAAGDASWAAASAWASCSTTAMASW